MQEKTKYTVVMYAVNIEAETPEGAAAIAATLVPPHLLGYMLSGPHIENDVSVEWEGTENTNGGSVTVAIRGGSYTATIV